MLSQQIALTEGKVSNFSDLEKRLADKKEELNTTLVRVPEGFNTTVVLTQLNAAIDGLAENFNITFSGSPKDTTSVYTATSSVKVTFTATAADTVTILQRLNDLPYMNRILVGGLTRTNTLTSNKYSVSLTIEFITRVIS